MSPGQKQGMATRQRYTDKRQLPQINVAQQKNSMGTDKLIRCKVKNDVLSIMAFRLFCVIILQ